MLKKTDPESRIKILEEEVKDLQTDIKNIKKAVNTQNTKFLKEVKALKNEIQQNKHFVPSSRNL